MKEKEYPLIEESCGPYRINVDPRDLFLLRMNAGPDVIDRWARNRVKTFLRKIRVDEIRQYDEYGSKIGIMDQLENEPVHTTVSSPDRKTMIPVGVSYPIGNDILFSRRQGNLKYVAGYKKESPESDTFVDPKITDNVERAMEVAIRDFFVLRNKGVLNLH